MIDLVQATFDLVEIGKIVGSLGSATLLGIATYVLWSKREAERAAYETKLQAAQDKLDKFQDDRIRELSALLANLGGK